MSTPAHVAASATAPRTVFYFCRHGSTAFNEGSRFRGSSNVALSDLGRQQAAAIATLLENKPIAAIACSPLPRAIETANIIARPKAPALGLKEPTDLSAAPMAPFVQVEPGLNSVCYGAWEGKTTDEVAALDPAGFDTFKNRIDRCVFENGETLDTLAARIRTTLLNLAEKYRGQQVVIVTHQICTRAFLCDLVGAPKSFYWQLGQEPGCINVVEYDGFKFYLKIMNWTPDMWDKVGVISKAW